MNKKFEWLMKEIKYSDKLSALNREFPGKSCGNKECEELCAGANEVAEMLHVNPQEMVSLVVRQEIQPKYHCHSGEDVDRYSAVSDSALRKPSRNPFLFRKMNGKS